MLRLDRPVIDWISLGRGLGVPAVRELRRGFASGGPYLIEVDL
jgi:hypothetical protein